MNLKENLENALSGEDVEVKPVISVTQAGIIEAMEQTKHIQILSKWQF